MSLYSITFNTLRRAVKHAAGQAFDAQLAPDDELVNEALMLFATCRPWPWRQLAMSLGTTAAQNYVDLPSDLAQIDSITAVGSPTGAMMPVTVDAIVRMRATTGLSNSFLYWYAVNWTPQGSVTGLPTPRLELFPTPSATTAGAFVGYYSRGIARLASATDVPDIPASMHPVLLSFCRLHALRRYGLLKEWEREKPAVDAEIAAAAMEVGSIQRNLGRMRGVGTARPRAVELPVQIANP